MLYVHHKIHLDPASVHVCIVDVRFYEVGGGQRARESEGKQRVWQIPELRSMCAR